MATLNTKQTEWNLKNLFDGIDDPKLEAEKKLVEEESYKFINKWKDRTDFLEDPKVLKEALDDYNTWHEKCSTTGDAGYYLALLNYLDQDNPEYKAKQNKLQDLSIKIHNDSEFFTLRLAKIPQEKQSAFLNHPDLQEYKHFIEREFSAAKHLLSEPEERIMNLKSKTSYSNWLKLTSTFVSKEERKIIDEDGSKKVKTSAEILSLTSSTKKEVRDSAAKAYSDICKKNIAIAEAEFNSILEYKKVNDELRKYERPDQAKHLGDDIETEVVDALVETVSSRFDLCHRYYKLKANLFGKDKLEYYERNVSYGESEKKYSYQEGVDLVYKVFLDLDKDFAEIFKGFVENGQIDVYPKKGKRGGAFCIGWLIKHPTYILLNYTDQLTDIRTLAHEAGHGINNELIKRKQKELFYSTPTSTAEVASTFMEDFVFKELFKTADDELKLSLMVQKLNEDLNSIFRQVGFYRFETDLHAAFREKGYLSKEEISQLFKKHSEEYMGPAINHTPGTENWWINIPHFRYMFYVYSYASGLLISKSLQNFVNKDHSFIEKVKEFLSAGTSDSPKNIFANMGIDITDKNFWNKGLDELENLLDETEELARKLGKIK